MSEHSGRTTSVWMATASLPDFKALSRNMHADVCVVGAGIAGLTTAYLLTLEGRSVVVLDDGPIVSGETERTTAHLSNAMDDGLGNLIRMHGVNGTRLAVESHSTAIDAIERIVRDERLDCGFERVDGYLISGADQGPEVVEAEYEAAHQVGMESVERVDRAPFVGFESGPALLFPHQGQIHPLKYLAGVAHAIVRRGGSIFAHTHAARIRGGAGAYVQTTNGWQVHANALVVATNAPVNDRVAIHSRQRPYRTYVVGLAVPVGTVPKVLYWDTADPYHYVRLQPADPAAPKPARDILIVGGEDHPTGHDEDPEPRFGRLEAWARARFPMAGEVRYRWSGQVLEPIDGLAFIGRHPLDAPNVYVATGDSGQGMTHGTIAGLLLTDLILDRPNRWAALYSPSRLPVTAPKEFLQENVAMASQYVDWITPGKPEPSVEQLARGAGMVVRRGLSKVAVYRDEAGQLHECSAVCPHLHGIVAWNGVECAWECPVHGSRFDPYGHVLNGPANTDLSPAGAPEPMETPAETLSRRARQQEGPS